MDSTPSTSPSTSASWFAKELVLGTIAWIASVVYLAYYFYPKFFGGPQGRVWLVVVGWATVLLAIYALILRSMARTQLADHARAENRRWLLLAAVGLFLMAGITRPGMNGGGDARWYGTMLADMITQTRHGVFPVWLGQSPYQFNGAIYPLRVAPAFHYLGALLDALSFHTLGIFALQNLLIVLLGLAGLFSCYFSLATLLPDRRQFAVSMAILYLACPGVLGIAYNTDLYMSWTTVPLVPLVWFATVRSFRDGGTRLSMLILGGSLGLCWWGHSPIALWLTMLASLAQLVRLAIRWPGWSCLNALWGALAFCLIAGYPIGSVLLFPPEPGISGAGFQPHTSVKLVVELLRSVFPATFLPLSDHGGTLSDFQIGYALCGMWLFLLWHFRQLRRPEAWTLFSLGSLLILLLTPVFGLDAVLWHMVPSIVRDITARWVMNRLYLLLASAVIFACAAALPDLLREPHRERALRWLLIVGCFWSVAEARKFSNGSRVTAGNKQSAPRSLPVENVMLTRYAYFIFPHIPDYFTDGVTDPNLENRLWRDGSGGLLASNFASAKFNGSEVDSLEFPRQTDSSVTKLPPFHLKAGQHYLLSFDSLNPQVSGILQLTGDTLFREYALPEYGGSRSFGAGGHHINFLPLETSRTDGENISLNFVRSNSAQAVAYSKPFDRVTLLRYDPKQLPVHVISWIPYRARVSTPEEAWLETPRMFQRGYTAQIQHTPAEIQKSKQGLVMIHVPKGTSVVELAYHPPLGLAFLFWTSLVAFALWAVTFIRYALSRAIKMSISVPPA